MTFKSRWADDFNKKLQELFRFDFDLPAVFIDTFHSKKSEHEVPFPHYLVEGCQKFADRCQDNKLETFEDALFEGSKTSPHKTEKLDANLLPCGKRYAEKFKGWSSLNG